MKIMDKLELIKEFNKYHPGYGVEWGYSKYVGGMTDTGNWIFEVLVSEPIEVLKVRLDILRRKQEESDEFNRKNLKEYKRVKDLPEEEQRKYYIEQRRKINEEIMKHFKEIEMALMWGKSSTK